VSEKKLILALVPNLMTSTRIESVVEKLGFDFLEIASLNDEIGDNPSEAGFSFWESIAPRDPVLIIFDLGTSAIPWEMLIQQLKASSVSKDIPLICFGPHVDGEAFKSARRAGADVVVARSKFMSDLPNLITNSLS
jgi:hypothetical protein